MAIFFATACAFALSFLIRHYLCYRFSSAYRFHVSLFVIVCSSLGKSHNKLFYSWLAGVSIALALFPLYISIPLLVLSELYTIIRGLKNPSKVFVTVP